MENVMWELLEVFFSMTSTVLHFLFVLAFLGKKGNASVGVKITVIIFVFGARLFTGFFFSESFIMIATTASLSVFIIGLAFYKNKILNAGLVAFFSIILGGTSEAIAIIIIVSFQNVTVDGFMQFSIYRVQLVAMSNLIMLLVIVLVKLFRKGSLNIANKKVMAVLCAMPIISVFIFLQFVTLFVALPYAPTINEVMPIISIVAVNVLLFILMEILIRQNEKNQKLMLIEVQNDAHITHIKQLTQYQNQIRTMSHDFRHQVQELYTLCVENQYDELQAKLTELSNRRSKDLVVDTGNIMLDSILTSKIEVAEVEKIDFKRKLDVEPELDYINSKICVLLGNALDNAIEACVRSDGDKFIGMELIATPKQFLCHIINTIGTHPQADGEFLKTTKQDTLRHGIGLQSMSQICEDVGGTLTYDFNEKHFNLWIKISILSV